MWIDVYAAVTTQAGRYVQGGGCTSVGVAGLFLGGGFGSFSKRYGLAASSLLQAEVVTADGVIRTVNAAQEPDLFWALKGGGGGSFGVVTRVTLQTHDLPESFGCTEFHHAMILSAAEIDIAPPGNDRALRDIVVSLAGGLLKGHSLSAS